MALKLGEKIPSVELHTSFPPTDPGNTVNLAEKVKGKKVILVGLPGAFTPT